MSLSEDPEEEKRQKAFKGILNKLTPDNYERLLEQILAVKIAHQEVGAERCQGITRMCTGQAVGRPSEREALWRCRPRRRSHLGPRPRRAFQTLAGLINQVFDKALTETTFSEMYASLCK